MTPSAGESHSPARLAENELLRLVGRDALQRLQDGFSALGAVTVCLGDVNGIPITRPTWGSGFSVLIGESPKGRAAFLESLKACAREPAGAVPSICHEGMNLYTTTVDSGGDRLGVLVVGSRASAPVSREAVEKTARRYAIDADELWRRAAEIDPFRGGVAEEIHRFADVLADTIAALYAQAERIERQLRDLQTVHSFTELLTGTRDLQEILDATVQRVVEVMAVRAAALRLRDRDTDELVLKAVCNLSEEYLKKGPVFLHQNLIDATACAGQSVYIADVPNDPRTRYPENARREGIVSGLCVPLTYRGETIGVIRVYTGEPHEFSESEEALLRSIGAQVAAAIITQRLWKEQSEAERMQRQLRAASEIQLRMLPAGPPSVAGLDIGCVYDPSLALGGDFFDFFAWPDGKLGFCVADVVGKGTPAALLMASVRASLRAHARRCDDVSVVMGRVNRDLFEATTVSEFATLVYGVFADGGAAITYTNAGHPPPLLLRGDDFIELGEGGMVIGIRADVGYDKAEVRLLSDDVLVIVTDGVTEALDFQGRAYGGERLLESIRRHRALDAAQFANQILWDVRRFAGLADQSDDITVVVFKVR